MMLRFHLDSPTTTVLAPLLALLLHGCGGGEPGAPTVEGTSSSQGTPARTTSGASGDEVELRDVELSDSAREVLELAFDGVSRMPDVPHEKNRSRTQEEIVQGALRLEQPETALRFIRAITNWQRGAAYASYARYCVEHGAQDQIEEAVQLAEQIAAIEIADSESQAWRPHRIFARLAEVHLLLGDEARASELADGLVSSEVGTVEAALARVLPAEELEPQLAKLRVRIEGGDFEAVRAAIGGALRLLERFATEPEPRSKILGLIEPFSEGTPPPYRVELHSEIARILLDAGVEGAGEDVQRNLDVAQGLLVEMQWSGEARVAGLAELAVLRARAGGPTSGRMLADEALARFEEDRHRIPDVFRGRGLRPLAEAYAALGDRETALSVYGMAIEEGALNPNGRPRSVDLAQTGLSMIEAGIEPDEALMGRIREIHAGLGAPW